MQLGMKEERANDIDGPNNTTSGRNGLVYRTHLPWVSEAWIRHTISEPLTQKQTDSYVNTI